MNTEGILKSLNLTVGEVLTLEKAKDRLEFEVLPVFNIQQRESCGTKGHGPCVCLTGNYCDEHCVIDCDSLVCKCKGPVGYIPQDDCHPYTNCPNNNCRPVQ